MNAPSTERTAPGDAQEAAEAPTLLDALARAPAAAALVVAALERAEDRKALRLAHPQLRDAVGEATTKLKASATAARPPTPRRWPRLEELAFTWADLAPLEALGTGTWGGQRTLCVGDCARYSPALDAPAARALAAALRRMPALRALVLRRVALSDVAAAELFRASSAKAAPRLRSLTLPQAKRRPAAARALAATGWRLEDLNMDENAALGAAGVAALVAAPTFAFRRLRLFYCSLDAAALLALADAPWPLEELDLSSNYFRAAADGPALAALSRRVGLRRLHLFGCVFSPANFKALVEADWPTLTFLDAKQGTIDGPLALDAAAFAGFPALEELVLPTMRLDEADARLLLSRRWPRLARLDLRGAVRVSGDVVRAALARGEWPALKTLRANADIGPLTLEDARRWAPALEELLLD